MNLEFKGVRWYNGRDCIGIVLCQDTVTKEEKAYIGSVSGYNEAEDIEQIKNWGTRFDPSVAKLLI